MFPFRCTVAAVGLLLWLSSASSQERLIDDLETLEGWRTGSQEEASLKLNTVDENGQSDFFRNFALSPELGPE